MPDPHKRAYRHPKYKTAYRVNNWCEYDQARRNRGDITLWLSQDTTAAYSDATKDPGVLKPHSWRT